MVSIFQAPQSLMSDEILDPRDVCWPVDISEHIRSTLGQLRTLRLYSSYLCCRFPIREGGLIHYKAEMLQEETSTAHFFFFFKKPSLLERNYFNH